MRCACGGWGGGRGVMSWREKIATHLVGLIALLHPRRGVHQAQRTEHHAHTLHRVCTLPRHRSPEPPFSTSVCGSLFSRWLSLCPCLCVALSAPSSPTRSHRRSAGDAVK